MDVCAVDKNTSTIYKKDLDPCINLLSSAVLESFMSAFLFAGVIRLE